ncbi:MAG: FKBP-type peptidyl-prolyl cis-trans isomerase, partial [Terrimicrobiaceae bacterium]
RLESRSRRSDFFCNAPGVARRLASMIRKFLTLAAVSAFLFSNTTMAQSALEKGQAYLAENATKPGVEQTSSGLQYLVINPGEGRKPGPTDVVRVNYRGTLLDGTEFDSSYKRNEPIEFPLNGVIKGWTEGLQLIKEGGKIQLFIPSNLAYGPRGAGGAIGPDETLIFEVELLKVL